MIRRLRLLLLTLLACAGSCLAPAALAQGVAMTVDRAGEVEVTAGGKTGRLNVLDYLPPGAEIRLAGGANATLVYLSTSQEWRFTGPGRYRLDAARPAALQGAAPQAQGVPAPSAQAMARMEPTQRERMALGAVVMRAAGPVRIVSPNNMDVLDTRPTLLWQAADGQAVQITVTAAGSTAPLAQTRTTAGQWTLPDSLPAGDYLWRAQAVSDAPGLPRTGRFRVIGDGDERRARFAPVPQAFAQRVSRAVMLENEDLPHDALLLWRQLSAERPDEEALRKWAE
jgi:hypothetical protein